MKAAPKAGAKKAAAKTPKPAGPGAIAAGGGLGESVKERTVDDASQEVETYTATGLDNALDLLEIVNAKADKASVGQQAAGIEKHPEVSYYICILDLALMSLTTWYRGGSRLRLKHTRNVRCLSLGPRCVPQS